MKNKLLNPNWITCIAFIICIVFTLFIYNFLPNDLPMQFSHDGSVNYTFPKLLGIFIMPGLAFIFFIYYKTSNLLDFSKVRGIILLLLADIAFLSFIAFTF